ncbi:hypothetical protein [Bradyrhizobium japonicum]|uniref:hypothetical protein n=1 Tax=Bradyrhizobium japonicum TaxID=375 RepID=UPI00201128F3|nr:hypothetical protein [Bradyrhizobium japonicum]
MQDGRIYIERINAPFLFKLKGSGSEFGAGLKHAIERGWLQLHESGTYVRLLGAGGLLTQEIRVKDNSPKEARGNQSPHKTMQGASDISWRVGRRQRIWSCIFGR